MTAFIALSTAPDRPASGTAPDDAAAPACGTARIDAEWVFGYGSLIWDPGFEFVESHLGQVHGYHRSFCIGSTRYRGTPESPGVVLGLDRGGSCIGVVYRLRPDSRARAIDGLYEREMSGGVYVPRVLSVVVGPAGRARTARRVRALAFVANHLSRSYARLADDEIIRRLSACCGQRGRNRDYALRTLQSLAEHGVQCPHLGRVGRLLRADGCD
jgi:cation transport protein ChaC